MLVLEEQAATDASRTIVEGSAVRIAIRTLPKQIRLTDLGRYFNLQCATSTRPPTSENNARVARNPNQFASRHECAVGFRIVSSVAVLVWTDGSWLPARSCAVPTRHNGDPNPVEYSFERCTSLSQTPRATISRHFNRQGCFSTARKNRTIGRVCGVSRRQASRPILRFGVSEAR